MIGDRCKPLNPGESNTVRLTLCMDEARVLQSELDAAHGPLRPRETNARPPWTSIESLRYILKDAIDREDG